MFQKISLSQMYVRTKPDSSKNNIDQIILMYSQLDI